MKKVILGLLATAALLVLSGCSGAGAAEGDRVVVVNHYETQVSDSVTTTGTVTGTMTEPETETVVVTEPEVVEVAEEVTDEVTVSESLPEVDILNLDDGYTIEGFSDYGNGVVLRFYEGRYSYERTDEDGVVREFFSGYFALQNGAIKIYFGDDDGGGYAIETHNGFLEEGYFYDIAGVRDDITIASIYRSGAL